MRAFQRVFCLCVCLMLWVCPPGVELKKRQNSFNVETIDKSANAGTQNVVKGQGKGGTAKTKTLKKQQSLSRSENENQGKDVNNGQTVTKRRGSKRQKKKEKKKGKSRDKGEQNNIENPGLKRSLSRKSTVPENSKGAKASDGNSGILSLALDALSNIFAEENAGLYRSDNLRCPDKLNSKLVKFYEEEVQLPAKDMKSVQRIVDMFFGQLWNHIKVNLDDLHFEKHSLVGSMSEDLSTKSISDFDYHLLINTKETQLTSEKIPKTPGYRLLNCNKGVLCENFGQIQKNKKLLSPQNFIRKLQSIVQKVVDSDKITVIPGCSRYRPGYKGPTVSVEFDCQLPGRQFIDMFRVELVPLLQLTDGKKFVAKAIARGVDMTHEMSWRESFTDQERTHIKKKSSEDLAVLRLMKHIVRNKAKPFNFLTSYFLKNVYFHMDGDGYPWQKKRLCDQLMDFLDFLYKLAKEKNLPCYFDAGNNLFGSLPSSSTIQNLQSTLQKVLENYETYVKEWIDFRDLKDEL